MPRSPSPSRSRSASPTKRQRSLVPDEKELSPFLIRVFVTKGKHTPLIDFDDGEFPYRDEFHVYGSKSSTPSSLVTLLYPSFPAPYRSPLARFSFRHVYVDASPRGLYRSKDLTSFSGRELMNTISAGSDARKVDMDMELDDGPSTTGHGDRGGQGRNKTVSEKTLDEYGFITGDYLSVSLYVPEPKSAAPGPVGREGRDARNGPGAGSGLGGGAGAGATGGPPRDGEWARGEALPPRAGYPQRDRRERDTGYRGAAGPPGGGPAGMGIRGANRRRSPSVGRNGNGYGRRSRSPDYTRRRDRGP